MNKRKGFSLIELLIVVAIIMIIAAIAVPNLIRSRMSAAQASAVASIHTISTAAVTYSSVYGNGFPPTLAALGNNNTTTVTCTNAELIDSLLTTGTKQGYNFLLVHGQQQVNSASSGCAGGYGYADGYMVTGVPVTVGSTGQNAYCSDASGLIRVNSTGVANPGPSPNCASSDTPMQ